MRKRVVYVKGNLTEKIKKIQRYEEMPAESLVTKYVGETWKVQWGKHKDMYTLGFSASL